MKGVLNLVKGKMRTVPRRKKNGGVAAVAAPFGSLCLKSSRFHASPFSVGHTVNTCGR